MGSHAANDSLDGTIFSWMQPWGSHGHSFCCCCTSNFIIYNTLCTAMTYHFIYLQPHLHSLCMKLQLSIKNEGWQLSLKDTAPLVFPKIPFHQFSFHLRWVTGPHLHCFEQSRFAFHFSVLFGVHGSITPIPGVFLPAGMPKTKPAKPRGISMSWSGEDFWRFHKGTMKGQWNTLPDQVLGANVDSWKYTYDISRIHYISMYVWTYICKTYMHIICTSTWHKCIDIQSHKISTGSVPNWTSSISSPSKEEWTQNTYTHTQEHLLNPPNLKHVNMCWKLPSNGWYLQRENPLPSWSFFQRV